MTRATLLAGLLAFAGLATANAGGYRFGVSDQAFYIPAIAKAAQPDLFPRDTPLLETQTGALFSDELFATIGTLLAVDHPALLLGLYALTLVTLWLGGLLLCRAAGFGWWTTAAAVLLMTFRHRIARTGANSLEGYMHPRQLAFGLGVMALAFAVQRRHAWSAALVLLAGVIHPTTALWFAVVVVVAAFMDHPTWRRPLLLATGVAGLAAVWALTLGPMTGRLVVMDDAWLSVLASKDYLFPSEWPLYAWISNLGYPVVIWAIYRSRQRHHVTVPGEAPVLTGLLALVVVFILSIPFTLIPLALAVQLQVSRVFWVLDVVAAAYIAWWLTAGERRPRLAVAVVMILALGSTIRGTYLLTVEHAERSLVEWRLPATPWTDVLAWLRTQPRDWHVLAAPAHAWQDGVSLRVGALRDTVLEESKDASMALYDRDIATRVADRMRALAGYDQFTADDLRQLDGRYAVDVAVMPAGRPLDLPVLYRNEAFVVYDLR